MRAIGIKAVIVLTLLAIGLPICHYSQASPLQREAFLEDAHYFDKYLQRQFSFRMLDSELLIRYKGTAVAEGVTSLESSLGLTVLHPRQQYYHHAHYRIPNQADQLQLAREATAHSEVVSAFPVLVDDQGYHKYVVGNELTVRFDKGLDDKHCRGLISSLGSSVVQDHWTPGYYTITVPEGRTLFQAIRAFNGLDEVRFAEFSSVGYDDMLAVPNDPDYPNQQNLNNTGQVTSCSGCTPYSDHDINAEAAWDITTGNPNVVVAIIDTGVDLDHPDLAANILPRGTEDWDFADPGDDVPEDESGHGTSCAGISAGVSNNGLGVAGIASSCSIMPLRVDLASGMNQNRADALNYAASRAGDFDGLVLSNSWRMSSGTYTAVYDAIENAHNAGCVVCFAAGNENVQPVEVPADSPFCICVGAVSPCDERKSSSSCDGESWGSSYGPTLDVCAPGVLIHTTSMGGGYTETFNGTSSACPHVAGVAALMLSVDPSLTPAQVQLILESTATDLAAPGFDNETGWGRIDTHLALEFIADLGTLEGTVTEQGSGSPVEAAVQAVRQGTGSTSTVTSDPGSGQYTMNLVEDLYDITVSAFGYVSATVNNVAIVTDTITTQNYDLAPAVHGTIEGIVTDSGGSPLSGVQVEVLDTPVSPVFTNGSGFYTVDLPGGLSYDVRYSLSGYASATELAVPLSGGGITTRNVTLPDWYKILIWEPDPTPFSGSAMQSTLAALGWDAIVTSDLFAFPNLLTDYDAIFVLVGIYSSNYTFSAGSAEEAALVDYLDNGGNLYLEGGDVWCYDSNPATLRGYFNFINEGDGSADLTTPTGVAGTFTDGMSFAYSGENAWIDQIGATSPAFEIFVNPADGFGCGIAHDAGTHRAIGASFEFGGLNDGVSPNTKAELMQAYLEFFGLGLVSGDTVQVSISAAPDTGTLPLTTQFTAQLINLTTENRRAAGRIDLMIANGTSYGNWRAGWTNLSPSEVFTQTWNQSIPALGSLVGANVFTLTGVDVTPAPFNQPPFVPSGDTDSASTTVTGLAP
jgi:subtilisin family serine protease